MNDNSNEASPYALTVVVVAHQLEPSVTALPIRFGSTILEFEAAPPCGVLAFDCSYSHELLHTGTSLHAVLAVLGALPRST